MSYEPLLLISHSDLLKHHLTLQHVERLVDMSNLDDTDQKVLRYLRNILEESNVLDIEGTPIITCHPELTSFNAAVRDKLDDWSVRYWTDN